MVMEFGADHAGSKISSNTKIRMLFLLQSLGPLLGMAELRVSVKFRFHLGLLLGRERRTATQKFLDLLPGPGHRY